MHDVVTRIRVDERGTKLSGAKKRRTRTNANVPGFIIAFSTYANCPPPHVTARQSRISKLEVRAINSSTKKGFYIRYADKRLRYVS